jgi:hypothetical protein
MKATPARDVVVKALNIISPPLSVSFRYVKAVIRSVGEERRGSVITEDWQLNYSKGNIALLCSLRSF